MLIEYNNSLMCNKMLIESKKILQYVEYITAKNDMSKNLYVFRITRYTQFLSLV
jgi:hypothetical protein